MAEALKHLIGAPVVRDLAHHLRRAWPSFDAQRFQALALDGLEALELKARVLQLADALEATLPADFDAAAAVIESSLGPPGEGDALDTLRTSGAGLAGWALWPVGEFVARRGLQRPERALRTLHALTQRFSAEYAIRPFIAAHPAISFTTLAAWAGDPSAHVRRLVSEGSRPRLPWGMRLTALVADPSPTLPLLRALQDDPSEYVRRSVANHLNDIAKDHPEIVVRWLAEHLPGAPAQRQRLLRHASRTLIKQGHPAVLAAWGLGRPLRGDAALAVSPRRVRIGDELTLTVTLQSNAARSQPLQVDYAVHHVKANGATSAKVFKGWRLDLAPAERRVLTKRHSMRAVTTRTHYPGRHEVDLRINGEVRARAHFELRARPTGHRQPLPSKLPASQRGSMP